MAKIKSTYHNKRTSGFAGFLIWFTFRWHNSDGGTATCGIFVCSSKVKAVALRGCRTNKNLRSAPTNRYELCQRRQRRQRWRPADGRARRHFGLLCWPFRSRTSSMRKYCMIVVSVSLASKSFCCCCFNVCFSSKLITVCNHRQLKNLC